MESTDLISNLSLNQRYWSIKVLVIEKDDVKNFKYGQGKIQKFTLMDVKGLKINAIMFNEIIEKLSNALHVGKLYVISNGQVKEINKNFYNVNAKFEIILNNLTEIIEVTDENNFLSTTVLCTIENLKINSNIPSDVILLVTKVDEIKNVFRQRDRQKFIKRDLKVIGLRSEILTFTLWEDLATTKGQQLKELNDENPIILSKSIVGKSFNGFTLSTTTSTTIEINPDLPESKELMDWFIQNKSLTSTSTFGGFLLTDLLTINTSEHSSGEIKHYDTKVSIKGISQEGNIWYNACNMCKSKVVIKEDIVECMKCAKKDAEYNLRYLIKLDVEDETSNAIFTIFDEEAENIIGMSVTELYKIKGSNPQEYTKLLTNIIGYINIFSIKAEDRIYGNKSLRSLTVQSMKKELDVSANVSKKIKLEKI